MKTKILLLLAVAALLAACKGKSRSDYEFVNNNSKLSTADSAAITDTSSITPKLVKTAGINFKVKNVQQVSENLAALTKQYGGVVIHQKIQSLAGRTRDVPISNDSVMRIAAFNTTGDMIVKIPSERLEDFITKVSHTGIYVNSSLMDIDDRSLDYLSARLKLKDRQELINQQKQGKIRIKNPTDVLLLKDDMVDAQIDNLKTDAAVKFSTVNLKFYQGDTILKETIANDDPSVYNIPFFQRVGLALTNGWSIFTEVIIAALNLWMFLLAAAAIWMAYRYYKKRPRAANPRVA